MQEKIYVMNRRLIVGVLCGSLWLGCASSNSSGGTGGKTSASGGGTSTSSGGTGNGSGGSTVGSGGIRAGTGGAIGSGGAPAGTGGGTAGRSGSGGAAPGTGGAASGGAGGGGGAASANSVLQRNNHPSRDGHFLQPLLTKLRAATLARDTTFSGTFAGSMWASPLYLENGPGGKGVFFAVTTGNDVIALDETTGAVTWMKNIGSSPQWSW